MTAIKEADDGLLYHTQQLWDELSGEDLPDAEFILDESGNKIPAHVCICYAREPSECSCATTSWKGYRYDED